MALMTVIASHSVIDLQRGKLMEEFELTERDWYAIETARNVARRFLKNPYINPKQIVGLANALYALERMPEATQGSCSKFGIRYRSVDSESREMRYIDFKISESLFEISIGGSLYDKALGGDTMFSEPGWRVEISAKRTEGCDLSGIECRIEEYLNLEAQITVSDESEIEFE